MSGNVRCGCGCACGRVLAWVWLVGAVVRGCCENCACTMNGNVGGGCGCASGCGVGRCVLGQRRAVFVAVVVPWL